MDYRLYEQRLEYLTDLASKGRLLSLAQVASLFDCSKSTVKRMLCHLRTKGIHINYSPTFKKFIINSPGVK